MVIYVVIPRTQLKINVQTVRERIQHNEKQVEFHNTVVEAKNFVKIYCSFTDIDLHHQEETVDFKPLNETTSKAIEKLNQAIEFDTGLIKLSKEYESYLKPLIDSNTS